MKILWLDINSSFSHSSLAIPALDAQLDRLQREEHEWVKISGSLNREDAWFISEILNFKPHLILSTLWLFNHKKCLGVLEKIKELLPKVRVILGGPEFLGENSTFLNKHRYIEAVFRGEGERIFPEFIASLDKGGYSSIDGFCFIDQNSNYVDNGEAIAYNFNNLAFPEESTFFDWSKPFIQIESSRGCFNRCAFCISGRERKIEDIDLSVLEKRILKAYQKGIREIRILDRTFNANQKRANEILNILTPFKGKMRFHLEIHPALLKDCEWIWELAARCELLHLEAGVQSLDSVVINECRRHGSPKDAIDGIKMLISKGLDVHTDLIAGLPGYTFNQVISDVTELIKYKPSEIQLELLKLLPGTQFRERANELGIIFNPSPPYEVLETPHISYNRLQVVLTLSSILDNYFNNPQFNHLISLIIERNPGFILSFTEHIHYNAISICHNNESRGETLFIFCKDQYPNELIEIAIWWCERGFSYKKGAGVLSKQWKYGDKKINPIFDNESMLHKYRYIEDENRCIWFKYVKNSNSSKPLVKFIEIL